MKLVRRLAIAALLAVVLSAHATSRQIAGPQINRIPQALLAIRDPYARWKLKNLNRAFGRERVNDHFNSRYGESFEIADALLNKPLDALVNEIKEGAPNEIPQALLAIRDPYVRWKLKNLNRAYGRTRVDRFFNNLYQTPSEIAHVLMNKTFNALTKELYGIEPLFFEYEASAIRNGAVQRRLGDVNTPEAVEEAIQFLKTDLAAQHLAAPSIGNR